MVFAILLTFDLSNPKSVDTLDMWIDRIKENTSPWNQNHSS